METVDLLKLLCETDSPSGREDLLYNAVEKSFSIFGEVKCDNMNNIIVHKAGKGNGKIMLMAHSDEVFLMVSEILDNGFVRFKGNGIDAKSLVSQEVTIHGKEKIYGIIGIKPPHLMNDEERKSGVKIEGLLIDTGLSDEKLRSIISIGDYVTLKRKLCELQDNNAACKAVDDRAGIAAMYVCAQELSNVNHDMDVYFACSCQEEVGHRGAKMVSYEINPDIGIAIDVTFDGGRFGDRDRENKLGGGPVICVGPNVHPKLRKKLTELACEYNIPYQVEVEPGNTGTDAWDIQISREGVASLLISIPIKYMHTSVEIVNIDDIKNTGRLLAKLIEKLSFKELEEILCF